jgi:hypothetical protein
MLRHSIVSPIVLLVLAGTLVAADKEVKCKLVSVDAKAKVIHVITDDGKKADYDVNEKTKYIGPKGGVSDKGLGDDRLVKDAELKLVIAGNNRTVHEIHLPERKAKDK